MQEEIDGPRNPRTPPDDKGRHTPVRDKETGKVTWAEVLTPSEVNKEYGKKKPHELPIDITPKPRPNQN